MGPALLVLLLLVGCAKVEIPEAPVCMRRVPGTGLSNGRGIVHMMKAGTYVFPNGVVNRKTGPQTFPAGAYATVYSSTGPLEWIKPDGTREVIPTEYLYPPGGIAPPTY